MEMMTEELGGEITKVVLRGRMDINGAAEIDLKMNVLGGSKKRLLIDLQEVSFIGSMGLRTLLNTARTVKNRGGKAAAVVTGADVEKVLTSANLQVVLPLYHSAQEALGALQ